MLNDIRELGAEKHNIANPVRVKHCSPTHVVVQSTYFDSKVITYSVNV